MRGHDASFDAIDPDLESGQAEPRVAAGKVSVTSRMQGPVVLQFRGQGREGADALELAAGGVSGSGAALPHLDRIQRSFGRHDVSSVRAHTGEQAELAARQLRAEAFAFGMDVAFAGQSPDLFTAAHEAAHVVQQRAGQAPAGGIGAAGDAHERHADAVARAVVRGDSAEPLLDAMIGGARSPATPARAVQCQEAPAQASASETDAAWAERTHGQVARLVDEVLAASELMNTCAKAALQDLHDARVVYLDFESRYFVAARVFITHVKQALEDAEALREGVKAVAGTVLGAALGELKVVEAAMELEQGVMTASKAIDGIMKLKSTAGLAGKVVDAVAGRDVDDKRPEVHPAETAPEVDWKGLLDTTLATFSRSMGLNHRFVSIVRSCHESEKFLARVLAGKGPSQARTSPEGQAAARIADGSANAISDIHALPIESVATRASTFASLVRDRLSERTMDLKTIQQNIAIRWMAGLTEKQLEAIGDADDYLEALGLIGSNDSRLHFDNGSWTSDEDQKAIWRTAQAETLAMNMLGKVVQWLGWKDLPMPAAFREHLGTFQADGLVWHAQFDPEGWNGGPVRVVSYQVMGDGATVLGRQPHERILFRVVTIPHASGEAAET